MALFRLVVVAALFMLLGAWASQATAHNNHVNKAKPQENVKFIKSFNKLGYAMPKQRPYSNVNDAETINQEKERINPAVIRERPSSKSQEYERSEAVNWADNKPQPSIISKIRDANKNRPSILKSPSNAKPIYRYPKPSDNMFKTLGTPVAEQPAPGTWPPPQPMP